MPVFFLTPDNCEFAKRAMRGRLPLVKSTHLTEALAAAFGYRTHAALLASLELSDARRPALVPVDPARLSSRLQELGCGIVDPSGLVEIVRAPEMPAGVWREFRNGDVAANNLWFRECERRDIPNVYIQLRTKYAKVSWDCISIDRRGEDHVREDKASALVDVMFRRFQVLAKGDPAKSEFFGSAFVGSVDRLSPSVARDIADDFFMRLYMPMAQRAAA
jgi:hypothetical protein